MTCQTKKTRTFTTNKHPWSKTSIIQDTCTLTHIRAHIYIFYTHIYIYMTYVYAYKYRCIHIVCIHKCMPLFLFMYANNRTYIHMYLNTHMHIHKNIDAAFDTSLAFMRLRYPSNYQGHWMPRRLQTWTPGEDPQHGSVAALCLSV